MKRVEKVAPEVYFSQVYGRGRTQIPAKVRKRMGIKDGERVVWIIYFDGSVHVRKVIPQLFRLTDSGRIEALKKREG